MTILETPRLLLREMTRDDLDFVATMMAHPDVSHFYERQFTRAASEEWLQRQLNRYRRDGHGLWLVVERTTGEPVGQVGLLMQEVECERHPEIGWLLHRPYWGRGYATEAAAATRDAAFARWGFDHVISMIRPVNVASRRVAARIGETRGRRAAFHGFEHFVYSVERDQTRPIGKYRAWPLACRAYEPGTIEAASALIALLARELPDAAIEHIGSSAIPGCAGKGYLDMLVAYRPGALEVTKDGLAALGFQRQVSRLPFPEDRPMRVGSFTWEGADYPVHAHVIAAAAPEADELRRFRDALGSDAGLRQRYIDEKQRVIAGGVIDAADYAEKKGTFIKSVLESGAFPG
jgi:RimJ/RimL family protein N-acetyltransferase/GrpB-like predicted nucleotidyltransferase (UPF0157 family)